jgi:hypothetical protein
MRTITDADLADLLGITVADVRHRCPADGTGWPHLRPKRSTWRFTDEQVAQIIRAVAVEAKRAPAPTAIPGQTERSKRRSA